MAKTILIADDDKGLLLTMETLLTDRGYAVLTAHDGREAVEKAKATRPHLIVMDVQMPRMDGDEAALLLKADDATRHIPVLFCTGLRTDKEIEESKEDGIFAKPVHFDVLVAKIRSLLGE
jgi:CheY-like chemotaxis protein